MRQRQKKPRRVPPRLPAFAHVWEVEAQSVNAKLVR